jgi:hypothetical protein
VAKEGGNGDEDKVREKEFKNNTSLEEKNEETGGKSKMYHTQNQHLTRKYMP